MPAPAAAAVRARRARIGLDGDVHERAARARGLLCGGAAQLARRLAHSGAAASAGHLLMTRPPRPAGPQHGDRMRAKNALPANALPRATRLLWSHLVRSVLVNSDNLIVNYDVKQSQFTKPTSEPRASDPEESNEAFDRAIR